MINAWSLAYDVLNGTLDENFPIKKKPMTDEIKLTGADEGVVNVPKGLEYHDPTHYVDGQGDIHLATSKDDLKVDTSDEGVVNIPTDINLDQDSGDINITTDIEHSDAWYDYTRNDPNRENPFTDPKDRARAERVVSGGNTAATSAEELIISIPPEFQYSEAVDHLVDEMPSAFNALSDNDDAIAHHVGGQVSSGINNPCARKYKEDESIEALKNYISTTYGGHYTSDTNDVQTLDLIESVGDAESFCRSNAIKYLSRYDKKGQAKRDILKALHYSLLLYHFSGQLNETPTRGYETF